MDVKDMRIDSGHNTHINDGSIKYASSGKIPQTERKTFNSNIELQSLGKLDTQVSRPCAIIGPDRVIPPTSTAEGYGKHGPEDLWPCPDVYRQFYELPLKKSEFQPSRNISPRQTFQENMQRIMVPPTYSSIKNSDEPSLKNNKNMPSEAKYCDVPFNVSSEHKTGRNSDISMSNVNPPFTRTVPGNGWPGVSVRPLRPYPAHEFYQYPEYPNIPGPRQMPVIRPQRSVHEEPSQVYPERLYQDANLRFKPYPTAKDRYPHTRYEYISSCPNSYPPPPSYPPHKPIQNHPYPIYPQVPLKYLDRRMPEPIADGFQRPPNPHVNMNTFRNHITPPYGPIPSNCYQNKSYPYQSDNAKQLQLNKLSYDTNNRVYLDLDNCRSKMYPENFYYSDRSQIIRGDIVMPGHPPVNSVPQHHMYRKDNTILKNYDYTSYYRNIDQPPSISNSSLSRLPLQFSPNAIAISPCDSNASNDTAQTHGMLQDDCGYVSQSSTTSLRSFDNGITNDMYRRHDYPNMTSLQSQINNSERSGKSNISNKKDINVRQFLQMWNEGDEESENNNKEITIQKNNNFSSNSEEQLYVLGLVNVPNEELAKYDHLQKLSKLPENIKGYNYIELLNQYEQIVESPSFNNIHGKAISKKEYPILSKPVNTKTNKEFLPRPMSPLDVEAKISQSVIHKEVGCNFEIKPCSPKLLNVDIATPVRDIMTERLIEKVTNPVLINVANVKDNMDNPTNSVPSSCNLSNKQYSIDQIKSSNYNLQELETNTGVCLASLPQLDNDIELNFPEVNQQFINSTKTDISNPTNIQQNITENTTEFNSNSTTPTSNSNNDKEASKLSKYRKTKKIELPTKDMELPPREVHSPSSTNQRIDSVIIKNPDNTKIHIDDSTSQKHKYVNVDTTKEYVESKKSLFSPNHMRNEESKTYDMHSETAIDFSLNKTEHHFYKDDNKMDSMSDVTTYNLDNKTEKNIDCISINNIDKKNIELGNSVTPDTSNTCESACNIKATNDDQKLEDYLNKPMISNLSKIDGDKSGYGQNRLCDENPNNMKQFYTTQTPDSALEYKTVPAIKSDKNIDSINSPIINNLSFTKLENLDDSVLNDKEMTETNDGKLITHKICDPIVEDETETALNKYKECLMKTSTCNPYQTDEKEIDNSFQKSRLIAKHKEDEDLNTKQARDDVVINTDFDIIINNRIETIVPVDENKAYNAPGESDNITVMREASSNLVAADQELSCILYSKPESSGKSPLNGSNIFNNNLVHSNSSTNICNISKSVSPNIDPILSGEEDSSKMFDQSLHLTEKTTIKNVESVELLQPSNYKDSKGHIIDTDCNNKIELNLCNTNSEVMINSNNESNIQVIEHDVDSILGEQYNDINNTETNSNLIENPQGLSSTLYSKTLPHHEPNTTFSLNDTNILESNLVHTNYLKNDSNVSNEVSHKIIDPVLSEGKHSPEMCLSYQSVNSAENLTLESVESVEYLRHNNDSEFTTANNSLFINSPLNDEFEDKIKDLDLFESKNSILAAKEKFSDTIFSKKTIKECSKCDFKLKTPEQITLEETVNTFKDHNSSKRNGGILNGDLIFEEKQNTINNVVTIIEQDENSMAVPENTSDKMLDENKNTNLLVKDCAVLSDQKHETSVSIEVVKEQEILLKNGSNNKENIIKENEPIDSTKEKEMVQSISLNEIQVNANITQDNLCINNELKSQNITSIDYDVKHSSEMSILGQNFHDENIKTNTTQLNVKVNTTFNNVEDIENSINELLHNEDSNSSNITHALKDSKNELLKIEIETELFENEKHEHTLQSSSITKYDGDPTLEDSIEKEKTCTQRRISFISKNKNIVQHSKQSKEYYSPWIQKLLLFTEGLCLPSMHDNLPVLNNLSHSFTENGILQDNTARNINKDNDNAMNILTETKDVIDSNSEKDISKVLNSDNVNTIISKVQAHHCSADLGANDQSIDDANNTYIPEASKLIENTSMSSDASSGVVNKQTLNEEISRFKDSIITKRRTLKRSFSESALEVYYENENKETLFPKRPKFIEANLCNIFQTNRRNSVSEIYNEDSVYILIDENNYVITDDEREKVCYTDIMHIDSNIEANNDSVHTLSENVSNDEYEPINSHNLVLNIEEKIFEETWVGGGCMETMFNDDIAEDIVISAPVSPDGSVASNCDIEKDTLQCGEVVAHMEKIKDIYGENMCNIDAQLVKTLYRTPQMNVNKTLISESLDTELISLKDIISNTEDEELSYEHSNLNSDDVITPLSEKIISTEENPLLKETYEIVNDKENFEVESISDIDNAVKCNENSNRNINTLSENDSDYAIIIPHKTIDKSITFSEKSKCSPEYCISSSPEVTSTTSEEKNSSILLKICNSNGSRISRLSEDNCNKRISYKLTESNHYKTLNNNYNSAGVLITKAAQKYIPPIKESVSNLKVKLPLPQHSLNKLKQLKKSKVEPKIIKMLPNSGNLITRHDIMLKKQKPKFEDVLMNIDKIQLKKCKEKIKKVKDVIPKMVIKKNESGSHYASSSNTNTKNKYNPDLTGRKWQPWVFLEKNIFVDKMAIKNKQKAIYCHRKKEFVLAEKFRKYKSVYNANFVISQPKLSDRTKGNLKYTIRLKGK